MTVCEEELNAEEVNEEWEENDEGEDIDFVNLYKSADDTGSGSEDSDDRVYSEKVEYEWDEKGGRGGHEEDKKSKEIEVEESSC
ncbi:hypothetical protein HOY80DRAFT_1045011 [Tuber brumale]|nr:hypothetical protein HOY80DRAFT_1045011 [Tuber brumale]